MSRQATVAVAGLAAVAAALAVALGFALADDDDDGHGGMMAESGYAGMMGAMGSMDASAMLARMQEVLGAGGFATMQAHMDAHRAGAGMTNDSGIDDMMHTMMDGMMAEIGLIPSSTDEHHESPTPGAGTPTAGH